MKALNDYEIPWRPAHELYAAVGWVFGAAAAYQVSLHSVMESDTPFILTASACGAYAVLRFKQGASVILKKRAMLKGKVEIIEIKDLLKKSKKMKDKIWIGTGFQWTAETANRAYDLLDRGVAGVLGDHATDQGAYWLHGVGLGEKDLGWPINMTSGHTLVVGTTGSGKTRLFDLLISQAIARDEVVIIIDPKGDKELRDNAKRACIAKGSPESFINFHPAFPEDSVRIDPMRNWNRTTELPSRLAALIPSETGSDPFTAFGWKAINDIVQGLIMTGERPSLRSIRKYIEGGVETLIVRALAAYFEKNVKDWEKRASPYVKQSRGAESMGYVAFYRKEVSGENYSQSLDGLISGFEHNREHFQKMVASLIPILNMLTSEPLDELLSPTVSVDDERMITDFSKIINNGQVAYFGLDSLADTTVGSAIGSILLADLTAVAGDRYNYGVENRPINVFVDEASEVINKPVIQLMNKGRGANFSVTIATQTLADFVVRLGDEAQSRQVLGNANNTFTLRTPDGETQKYLAESFAPIMATSLETQFRDGHSSNTFENMTGMVGETLKKTERELIHPSMFGILPNLHMYVKLANGQVFKSRIPVLVEKK